MACYVMTTSLVLYLCKHNLCFVLYRTWGSSPLGVADQVLWKAIIQALAKGYHICYLGGEEHSSHTEHWCWKEPLLPIPLCSNQDPHGCPNAHNQPHQRPAPASAIHRTTSNFPRNSPNRQDHSFKDCPDGVRHSSLHSRELLRQCWRTKACVQDPRYTT